MTSGDGQRPWDQVIDDDLVERLGTAMQRACAEVMRGAERPDGWVDLPAPEATTAMLNLLATLLESAPQCRTPAGMRKVSEAAGKELLVLMRGCRDLTRPGTDDAIH